MSVDIDNKINEFLNLTKYFHHVYRRLAKRYLHSRRYNTYEAYNLFVRNYLLRKHLSLTGIVNIKNEKFLKFLHSGMFTVVLPKEKGDKTLLIYTPRMNEIDLSDFEHLSKNRRRSSSYDSTLKQESLTFPSIIQQRRNLTFQKQHECIIRHLKAMNEIVPIELVQSILLQLDAAAELNPGNFDVCIIFNFVDLNHSNYHNLLTLKLFDLMKYEYPMKVKEMVVLATSNWFCFAHEILKRFFTPHSKDFKVWKVDNYSELCSYLPVSNLPTSLKGTYSHSHFDWVNNCLKFITTSPSLITRKYSFYNLPPKYYHYSKCYSQRYSPFSLHLNRRRSIACSFTQYDSKINGILKWNPKHKNISTNHSITRFRPIDVQGNSYRHMSPLPSFSSSSTASSSSSSSSNSIYNIQNTNINNNEGHVFDIKNLNIDNSGRHSPEEFVQFFNSKTFHDFKTEYEICSKKTRPNYEDYKTADLTENRGKNRYIDVLCVDRSRVKLSKDNYQLFYPYKGKMVMVKKELLQEKGNNDATDNNINNNNENGNGIRTTPDGDRFPKIEQDVLMSGMTSSLPPPTTIATTSTTTSSSRMNIKAFFKFDLKSKSSGVGGNVNNNRFDRTLTGSTDSKKSFQFNSSIRRFNVPYNNWTDYINANYVDGYQQEKAYINTQGPLQETIADFWEMIWEQQVLVILMLTRLMENERIKCSEYWPAKIGEIFLVGPLQIKTTEVDRSSNSFHFTYFDVFDTSKAYLPSRRVCHVHYITWPDYGVPNTGLEIFQLRTHVEDIQKKLLRSNIDCGSIYWPDFLHPHGPPIVVHCSAGIGRTGTFCCIDININRLLQASPIDVMLTVMAIRRQRAFSVQTEHQYHFCYLALDEFIRQNLS
ncbi:hypothetical protein SNEBB_008850 [Seison nebaliae]|nr:hypothetical protein SNEBB_008850 [Seison nebaliae]